MFPFIIQCNLHKYIYSSLINGCQLRKKVSVVNPYAKLVTRICVKLVMNLIITAFVILPATDVKAIYNKNPGKSRK